MSVKLLRKIVFPFLILAATLGVYARDITVDSSCSLNDAISAANRGGTVGNCRGGSGADTIWLTRDLTLRGELSVISSNITIEGNGHTISGNSSYQIFAVSERGDLTVNNLSLVNGRGALDGEYYRGGAILNRGETTVNYSTLRRNSADYGGAIHNLAGRLSINNSIFSDNYAGDRGGAIRNHSLQHLDVNNSLFEGNSAEWGGAIHSHGETYINNSSFFDNTARTNRRQGGGGLYISGYRDANVNYYRGRLFMHTSSLSGNRGGDCIVYANYGELIESNDNHIGDDSCWARWDGGHRGYCPSG